jgi:hypothetical protein
MLVPAGIAVIWLATLSAPKAAGSKCVTISDIRARDIVFRMGAPLIWSGLPQVEELDGKARLPPDFPGLPQMPPVVRSQKCEPLAQAEFHIWELRSHLDASQIQSV